MNGYMNGWVVLLMDEWWYKWLNCKAKWTNGYMNEWMNMLYLNMYIYYCLLINGWKNGWLMLRNGQIKEDHSLC